MIFRYIITGLCIVTLWSCAQQKHTSPDQALARVNDRFITLEDFQKHAAPMHAFKGMDTQSAQGKKKVLDDMVFQELIFQQALKEGLHLESLEVKHAIVDQYLKKKHRRLLEKYNEEIFQTYYEEHKQNLDKIRASHILIKIDSETSEEQALEKINQIRQEITSEEISFEEAAKKYSQDGSSQKGGDLNYFSYEMMVEPFSKEAFSLTEVGQISQPVKTQFGYHLIELTDKQVGYDLHRDRIRAHLISQAISKESHTYFTTLKNDNDVSVFYEKLPKDQ